MANSLTRAKTQMKIVFTEAQTLRLIFPCITYVSFFSLSQLLLSYSLTYVRTWKARITLKCLMGEIEFRTGHMYGHGS